MATIVTIDATDLISDSRADLNTNFSNLNSDKIETSYLDTDTAMAANSDVKIPSQKAVKTYIDTSGGANASTTVRGIVEEATSAEMIAGTAAGGTGARLFLNPTLVAETGADKIVKTKSTGFLDPSIIPTSQKVLVNTTEVTNATTSEITLFSGTVPGGTLGTNNALKISAFFSAIVIGAGDTITIRLKYGATTIASFATIYDVSVTINSLMLTGFVVADGATNAQKGALHITGGELTFGTAATKKVIGGGSGSATIDSTTNQTLTLTAQLNDTSGSYTAEFWVVEAIR